MNYKLIGRFIAMILLAEAVFMLPPTLLGFADGRIGTALAFLFTMLLILTISGALFLICRGAGKGFFAKEGMLSVGLGWIVMSLLGCLPFCLSGEIPHYVDALFEMVSGFTTTGAHGSKSFSNSPWLIAALHVLRRLSVPRHPPLALCSFT